MYGETPFEMKYHWLVLSTKFLKHQKITTNTILIWLSDLQFDQQIGFKQLGTKSVLLLGTQQVENLKVSISISAR